MRAIQNYRQKTDGFALIDLLATLAIIALMAAMAVPAYNQFLANLRLETACRSLVTEIRFGQQAAMTEFRVWKLTYLTDGVAAFALDPSKNQYVQVRPRLTFPPGITYAPGYVPTGYSMNFTSSGGVSAEKDMLWTVILSNSYGSKRYVIITPVTGRVRISTAPP